jgi:hypothetical protein
MSEYQYYEFRAVDRPLTGQEMARLRGISSRARITATSFVNTYNYGDLRADPDALARDYFDAFVYVANWGTHRFMLRLPKRTLARSEYAPFGAHDCFRAWTAGEHLLVSFSAEELESDWEEGEGWMDSLLPVRADLLRGDLRSLYLGWLLAVQMEEVDDGKPEPPVPAGLRHLSEPLERLVEFLGIDENLLDSAAEASPDQEIASPSKDLLAQWIANLPEGEKDVLLLRAAEGDSNVGAEVLRRFQAALPKAPATSPTRRTAGQLRRAAETLAREAERREQERLKLERERELKRKAAEKTKRLDALATREESAWSDVDGLIRTKRPSDYDRAVLLLADLRDLAARSGGVPAFEQRLRGVVERHSSKSSFLRKLREADVGSENAAG